MKIVRIRGYTLVELLVVISIMAIMTLSAMPIFRNYQNDQKVKAAALQLQEALREAQNNALSGVVCAPNNPADNWGIIFGDDQTTSTNNYQVAPVSYSASGNSLIVSSPCPGGSPPSPPLITSNFASPIQILKLNGTSGHNCANHGHLKSLGIAFQNVSGAIKFASGSNSPNCAPNSGFLEFVLAPARATSPTVTVHVDNGGAIYTCQGSGC